MTLYGTIGITHHGWAKVLTVMSPRGARAVLARLGEVPGLERRFEPGGLPRYLELRAGALRGAIEAHSIRIVSNERWRTLKDELGEAIYD